MTNSSTAQKPLVLIVDDDPVSLELLNGILSTKYQIETTSSGLEALIIARDKKTPDLILLDIMMPDKDGYEICRRLKSKKNTKNIPIIFTTSLTAFEDESKGLEVGAADYITKPFNSAILMARVNTHLQLKQHHDQLEEHVEKRTEALRKTLHTVKVKDSMVHNLMETMNEVLFCSDHYNFEHALPVSELSVKVGQKLGLNPEKIKALELGGMLHDIGKVYINDNSLSSYDGPDQIRQDIHPKIGAKLFALNSDDIRVHDIILKHHERLDGSGYPTGLKDTEIDQLTRIISAVDSFVNLISEKHDTDPLSTKEAIKLLLSESTQGKYDKKIIDNIEQVTRRINPLETSMDFRADFIRDLVNFRHLTSFREPLSNYNNYRYLLLSEDSLCRKKSNHYQLALIDFLDLADLNLAIGFTEADKLIDSLGFLFQDMVKQTNSIGPAEEGRAILCRKGADYLIFSDLPETSFTTLINQINSKITEIENEQRLSARIIQSKHAKAYPVEKAIAELFQTERDGQKEDQQRQTDKRIHTAASTQTKQPTNLCVFSDRARLCASLDKAGAPRDSNWRSLLIYLRSQQDESELSNGLRNNIKNIVKNVLQERDFSDTAYRNTVNKFQSLINAPLLAKLGETKDESGKLLEELKKMILSRKGDVQSLESTTVDAVSKRQEPKEIISDIRAAFHDVISDMEMDTARLECICNIDQLTGLNNRRAFDTFIDAQVTNSLKIKKPAALLFLDIDHFKKFNDTYGHRIGDQALTTVSKIIQENIARFKEEDGHEYFGARYGGEEFTVIIPEADTEEAIPRAETIRENIEKYNFIIRDSQGQIIHKSIRITVSIGIAELNHQWKDDHITRFIDLADQALYKAKDNGRNQIATN